MTAAIAWTPDHIPLAPGTLTEHGPACGHPTRYRSQGGRILCELCERLRTGWNLCPGCGRFEPLEVAWWAGIAEEDPDDYYRCCADCNTLDNEEGLF